MEVSSFLERISISNETFGIRISICGFIMKNVRTLSHAPRQKRNYLANKKFKK